MSYETFKETFFSEICRQAGDQYEVSLQKITKNNGIVKDAVSISRAAHKIAPVIYIDSFYEKYQNGGSVIRLASALLKNFEEMDDVLNGMDTDFFSDYEKAKSHIYCRLVNVGMNREILREIPYRPYLDLAVVYYYMAEAAAQGQATITVSRKHLEAWGITEDELDRQAWENTVSDLKPQCRPMREIMREYLGAAEEAGNFMESGGSAPEKESGGSADEEDGQEEDFHLMPMYVLTNQKKAYGAICIRYPGVLSQIAGRLEGDFYILPSSVHECILVPADRPVNRDMLREMVMDINHTQVDPQEVLADQVYLYSRALEKIIF